MDLKDIEAFPPTLLSEGLSFYHCCGHEDKTSVCVSGSGAQALALAQHPLNHCFWGLFMAPSINVKPHIV